MRKIINFLSHLRNESWKKANLPIYGMLKRENGHNLLDKLVAKLKQCVKIFVDMKDE